jgi:hypothetical protein
VASILIDLTKILIVIKFTIKNVQIVRIDRVPHTCVRQAVEEARWMEESC